MLPTVPIGGNDAIVQVATFDRVAASAAASAATSTAASVAAATLAGSGLVGTAELAPGDGEYAEA